MKLAKRISVALLAACVVGGSAFAMTACGGGSTPEPEPTPIVSQEPDVDPVVSTPEVTTDVGDYAVNTTTEGSHLFRTDGEAGLVYLDNYESVSFNAAVMDLEKVISKDSPFAIIEENKGSDRCFYYTTDWQEIYDRYTYIQTVEFLPPDDAFLAENEVSGFININVCLDRKTGEGVYDEDYNLMAYVGYDESDYSIHVYKMRDHEGNIYEGEAAHNKMIELVKAVVEQ